MKLITIILLCMSSSIMASQLSLEQKLKERKEKSQLIRIEKAVKFRVDLVKKMIENDYPEVASAFSEHLQELKGKLKEDLTRELDAEIESVLFETSSDLICEFTEDTCSGSSCDSAFYLNCYDEAGHKAISEVHFGY